MFAALLTLGVVDSPAKERLSYKVGRISQVEAPLKTASFLNLFIQFYSLKVFKSLDYKV